MHKRGKGLPGLDSYAPFTVTLLASQLFDNPMISHTYQIYGAEQEKKNHVTTTVLLRSKSPYPHRRTYRFTYVHAEHDEKKDDVVGLLCMQGKRAVTNPFITIYIRITYVCNRSTIT